MGLLTLFGFGAPAKTTDNDKSPTRQVYLLRVSGMHCGACAARLEKIAKRIVGVTAAKVNQQKGTAEITYDPKH